MSSLNLIAETAPGTPSAGSVAVYPKADKLLYYKDDTGTERSVSAPTVITVANEASDTTCFPAFFTAATGDLEPKTNTGLTYNSATNAFGVGLLTATGVADFSAGSAGSPAITRTGDTNTGLYFPAADKLSISTAGAQRLGISAAGNVVVGDASADAIAKLCVQTEAGSSARVYAYSSRQAVFDTYYNSNDSYNGYLDISVSGNDQKSAIRFLTQSAANTDTVERMRINTAGNVSIVGALSKGSGSFLISHPLPALTETHNLVHSFIEGPQADLIYRGRVALISGKAEVNIDIVSKMTEGTFEVLCQDVQCFTTNESDWTCVRGKVVGNLLTIDAEDATAASLISWMVIGERKDPHMIETTWTDAEGHVIVEPMKVIP